MSNTVSINQIGPFLTVFSILISMSVRAYTGSIVWALSLGFLVPALILALVWLRQKRT